MKVVYELTPETYDQLKRDAAETVAANILNNYSTIVVDAQAASQILGVSINTVRNYATSGKLKSEPRVDGGKIRFRLSNLLKLKQNEIQL